MTKVLRQRLIIVVALLIAVAVIAGIFISAIDSPSAVDAKANLVQMAENNGQVDEADKVTQGTRITNGTELSAFLKSATDNSKVGYLDNDFSINNGFGLLGDTSTNAGPMFSGTLYGNGYTITIAGVDRKNFYYNGTNSKLFGDTTVSFVHTSILNIIGGIIPAMNNGTVKGLNVVLNAAISWSTGNVDESTTLGGIVGIMLNNSVLDDCSFVQNANMECTKSSGKMAEGSSEKFTLNIGGCVGTVAGSVISNTTYTLPQGVRIYGKSWGYGNSATLSKNRGVVRTHCGGMAGMLMNGGTIFNVTANGSGNIITDSSTQYQTSASTAGIIVGCAVGGTGTQQLSGTADRQSGGRVNGAIINWHGYAKYHQAGITQFVNSKSDYYVGGQAIGAIAVGDVSNIYYLSGIDSYSTYHSNSAYYSGGTNSAEWAAKLAYEAGEGREENNNRVVGSNTGSDYVGALVAGNLANDAAGLKFNEVYIDEYASGSYEDKTEVYNTIKQIYKRDEIKLYFQNSDITSPLALRYDVPLDGGKMIWRVIVEDETNTIASSDIAYYETYKSMEEASANNVYIKTFDKSESGSGFKVHVKFTLGHAAIFEYGDNYKDDTVDPDYYYGGSKIYDGYKFPVPALRFYIILDNGEKEYTTGTSFIMDDVYWGVYRNGSANNVYTMDETRNVPITTSGDVGYYILSITDRRGSGIDNNTYDAIDKEKHLISYTADRKEAKDIKIYVNPKKVTPEATKTVPESLTYDATSHAFEYAIKSSDICSQYGNKDTGTEISVVYTNKSNGERVTNPTNVGTYIATVSADSLANTNYTFDTIIHEFTINKKSLEIVYSSAWDDITYNAQEQRIAVGNGIDVVGFQGQDNADTVLTVSYTSREFKNAGSYTVNIQLRGTGIANNYDLTGQTLSKEINIKQALVIYDRTLNVSEDYTGSVASTLTDANIDGFIKGVGEDKIEISKAFDFKYYKYDASDDSYKQSTVPVAVGTYKVEYTFDIYANPNYYTNESITEYFIEIKPLKLSVDWNDYVDIQNNRAYTGSEAIADATLVGVYPSQSERDKNFIRGYSYYSGDTLLATAPTNVGTYRVVLDIVKTDNYTFEESTVNEMTFDITALHVSVTLDENQSYTLQYGDEVPDYTPFMSITQGAFFEKDNVNIVLKLDYERFNPTLGYHNIVLDTELTTGEFSNYIVEIPESARVEIVKRSIAPTFFVKDSDNGIYYNGNAWTITTEYEFEGFAYNVAFNTADAPVAVGGYIATASLTDDAAQLFEFTDEAVCEITFNIEKRNVTINVNEIEVNYGEDFVYGYTYNEDVTEENKFLEADIADAEKLDIVLSSEADGVFNAGEYQINVTITGLNANNYNVTINGANLFIKHLVVDITWQEELTWTYDGTEKTVTATINDQEIAKALSLVYNGNANKNAGEYTATATLEGENSINYMVNSTMNSVDYKINRLHVEFDLKVGDGVTSITYGDEIPKFEADSIEKISGDFIETDGITILVRAMCERYDDVGIYDIGISLHSDVSDEVINNYEVIYPKTATLTVVPREVTVSITPMTDTTYDAFERKANINVSGAVNNDNVDPILLVNGVADDIILNAGNYELTVEELGNKNYTLAAAVAPITFNIAQLTVTIRLRDAQKGLHASDETLVFGTINSSGAFIESNGSVAYTPVDKDFIESDVKSGRVKVGIVSNFTEEKVGAIGTLSAMLSVNEGDNYILVVDNATPARVIISGRLVEKLVIGNEAFVYSGKDMASEIFFKDADMSMLNVVVTQNDEPAEFKNAGIYRVTVSATEEAEAAGTYVGTRYFDVTIHKAPQTLSNVKVVVNYNKLTVVISGEAGEAVAKLNDGEYTSNLVFNSDIKTETTYTVTIKLGETENLLESEELEITVTTGINPSAVRSILNEIDGQLTFAMFGEYKRMLSLYERLSADDKLTISRSTLNTLAEQYTAMTEGAASAISDAQKVASKAVGMGLSLAVGLISGAGAILLARKFF